LSDKSEVTSEGEQKPQGYTCPKCGKTFEKMSSLKAHALRSHRLVLGDDGKPIEPKKPEQMEKTAKPTGNKLLEILPESKVPDVYELLYNQLVLYGLTPRNAAAVVDYMKNYRVDDLIALNRALNDVGMPRNRKKLFLESWINARGLRITPELAKELDLLEERPYPATSSYPDWRRVYHFGGRPEPPKPDIRDQLLLKAFEKLTNPGGNDNVGQLIAAFQQEIQSLRQQLEQERQKRIEQRIKFLEEKLKERERHVGNVELKKLDILDKKTTELINLIKAMGSVPISPPKREKVQSDSSIYDFLPEDLVISEEVNESE